MEELFIAWMKEYGYAVLFLWSILEGESGLVMAGLFAHTGDMQLLTAIVTAGLGGFFGDQIYFYIGRFNKNYAYRVFKNQRRKLALARLLLHKHGWPIIFAQRYIYGMRTIIPLSIGLTGYSAKMFALINFFSALCWSSLIIVPVWYFGNEILSLIAWAKAHWYFALPFMGILVGSIYYYFHKMTGKTLKVKRG